MQIGQDDFTRLPNEKVSNDNKYLKELYWFKSPVMTLSKQMQV